mgnify:CR=1 FL=1
MLILNNKENKELFDSYIVRLEELNNEYKRLSIELTESGPNELTVSALIDNLKLRLNLLYRLKEQLNELNTEKIEPLSSILNEPLRSRKDKIDDGKIRDKILENSPKKNEEFFVVPKVIE